MDKKFVYFCVDDNYLYPLIFCIYRIEKTSTEKYTFIIVYDSNELSKKSITFLQRFGSILSLEIEFIKMNLSIANKATDHISNTAFLKCMIFTLPNLPEQFIISDVDVLYRDGWEKIWNTSESLRFKSFIRVCPDRQLINPMSNNLAIKNSKDFYFNSGIILVNSQAKPEFLSADLIYKTINNYEMLGFQWKDQCVLNYLLTDDKAELESSYNYYVVYPDDSYSGYILHFLGGIKKPWTLPIFPIRRFLYINLKTFKGAYGRYYCAELYFLVFLMINSPCLAYVIFLSRIKSVRAAPNLSYFYAARAKRVWRTLRSGL